MKKNARRGASSDGFGKQAERMRTWRGAAGRSRCGQRRLEKLSRRQSTAVYGEPAVMWSAPIVGGFWFRYLWAGGVHQLYMCVQLLLSLLPTTIAQQTPFKTFCSRVKNQLKTLDQQSVNLL